MDLWLLVAGMGVITVVLRLSLIAAGGRIDLPPLLIQGLKFVPPAVLSAIIIPEVTRPEGVLDFSPGNPRLVAGLVAAVVAWRTKNVLLTIAAGMIVLWLYHWIVALTSG